MSYQLEQGKQTYGNQEYLAHKITGETEADDRYLFGMRVPAYGILNFGAMTQGQIKRIALANAGINSQILLRSVYAFGESVLNDEIRFRLFLGNQQLTEQKLVNDEMPYQFPDGAIVDSSLSIEIEPRYDVTQLLIYWQPVHILSYLEVN